MTNLLISLIAVVTALSQPPQAGQRPEWDDLAVLHVGTEKPHATLMVYPSVELASAADRTRSPWFRSLNGIWKFNWSPGPASRPADFYRPDFADAAWKTIRVPGSIEIQGFGIPIYVNIGYTFPFDRNDPRYGRMVYDIWGHLKDEVERARA